MAARAAGLSGRRLRGMASGLFDTSWRETIHALAEVRQRIASDGPGRAVPPSPDLTAPAAAPRVGSLATIRPSNGPMLLGTRSPAAPGSARAATAATR